MINVEKIISFEMDQNCYLVYDDNGDGFLVDPGLDTLKILKACENSRVKVTHILLTHCHYDHIFSVNELRGHKTITCGEVCSVNMAKESYNLSAAIGEPFTVEGADLIVSDGDVFNVGRMKIKAISTPGHTSCSFCYLVEDKLFSGDTLFRRGVGRWDLPTGDSDSLICSIKEKLFTLPEDVKVYCGHGEDTTVGYEKKFNLYMS